MNLVSLLAALISLIMTLKDNYQATANAFSAYRTQQDAKLQEALKVAKDATDHADSLASTEAADQQKIADLNAKIAELQTPLQSQDDPSIAASQQLQSAIENLHTLNAQVTNAREQLVNAGIDVVNVDPASPAAEVVGGDSGTPAPPVTEPAATPVTDPNQATPQADPNSQPATPVSEPQNSPVNPPVDPNAPVPDATPVNPTGDPTQPTPTPDGQPAPDSNPNSGGSTSF